MTLSTQFICSKASFLWKQHKGWSICFHAGSRNCRVYRFSKTSVVNVCKLKANWNCLLKESSLQSLSVQKICKIGFPYAWKSGNYLCSYFFAFSRLSECHQRAKYVSDISNSPCAYHHQKSVSFYHVVFRALYFVGRQTQVILWLLLKFTSSQLWQLLAYSSG